jgi:hypothetical protein
VAQRDWQRLVANFMSNSTHAKKYKNDLGFEDAVGGGKRLRWARCSLLSEIDNTQSGKLIEPEWKRWDAFVTERDAAGAGTALGPVYMSSFTCVLHATMRHSPPRTRTRTTPATLIALAPLRPAVPCRFVMMRTLTAL